MSLWTQEVVNTSRENKKKRAGLLGLKAPKALNQGVKAAFDRLGMTFQGRLSPAMVVVLIADFDKQPARQDTEILDGFDFHHDDGISRRERRQSSDSKYITCMMSFVAFGSSEIESGSEVIPDDSRYLYR